MKKVIHAGRRARVVWFRSPFHSDTRAGTSRPLSRGFILARAVVLGFVVLTSSCNLFFNDGNDKSSDNDLIGTTSQFWAMDLTDESWYQLDATLLAVGQYSYVYVENDYVDTVDARAIAAEFDNRIYPMVTTKFAPASDVDGTGKITILILDIRDGFTGTGGYVAGFFQPHHLFDFEHSNRADMIFLDSNPGVPGSLDFFITAAHELQHLVNFNKTFLLGGGKQQEIWINEGLSSAAEFLYKDDHIGWKIGFYNEDPSKRIAEGYQFLFWENLLENYATVYLFFQWLRIHASNGDGVYREILNSSDMDYRSVKAATQTRIYQDDAIMWKDIFLDWLVANYLNNDVGLWGYQEELATTPPVCRFETEVGEYPLWPGEAIFVDNEGNYTVPDTNPVLYAGISSDGDVITGNPLSDPVVIVYNVDTNYRGNPTESGTLPTSSSVQVLDEPDAVFSYSMYDDFIYPIDVQFDESGRASLPLPDSTRTTR